MRRCDSAAMVSMTRELFPDPETPVKTVRTRFGDVEGEIPQVVLAGSLDADAVVRVGRHTR
jgi:hypothetical protein